MSEQSLPQLDVPDASKFKMAQHQVHSIVQWLARMENSYGPEAGAPSRIRLHWCGDRRAIRTHGLADGLELELRVAEMVLQFLEDGEPSSHAFAAEEHSPAHAEAWLLIELLHRGIDRSRFTKELPYEVSHLLSGDGQEFSPEAYRDELSLLARWMSRGAEIIGDVEGVADHAETRQVLVVPDDLSLEIEGPDRVVGFKPVGSALDEPYFYVRGRDGRKRSREDAVAASHLLRSGTTGPLDSLVRGH